MDWKLLVGIIAIILLALTLYYLGKPEPKISFEGVSEGLSLELRLTRSPGSLATAAQTRPRFLFDAVSTNAGVDLIRPEIPFAANSRLSLDNVTTHGWFDLSKSPELLKKTQEVEARIIVEDALTSVLLTLAPSLPFAAER